MGWFIRFAMRALMPGIPGLKGLDDAALKPFLRRYFSEAPAILRLGLHASTWVFLLTPLFTVYLPIPAFFLRGSLLERHAQKSAAHPWYLIRSATMTIKMVGGLCWGADPEIRESLGVAPYPPDPGTWREGS